MTVSPNERTTLASTIAILRLKMYGSCSVTPGVAFKSSGRKLSPRKLRITASWCVKSTPPPQRLASAYNG